MTRFLLMLAIIAVVVPSALHAQGGTARTIEIQASDTMRFTPDRITARSGETLRVVLKDVGTVPKAAMAHNFVLLKKGVDVKAFVEKSATARDTDFIAPALEDQALVASKLVGPGETTEVTFTAPAVGSYPFICTFPGHYAIGMKGTLVVK